eukprot:933106-Prorocentrum_minimum.AAC.1
MIERTTNPTTKSRDKTLIIRGWHLPGCATSRVRGPAARHAGGHHRPGGGDGAGGRGGGDCAAPAEGVGPGAVARKETRTPKLITPAHPSLSHPHTRGAC